MRNNRENRLEEKCGRALNPLAAASPRSIAREGSCFFYFVARSLMLIVIATAVGLTGCGASGTSDSGTHA